MDPAEIQRQLQGLAGWCLEKERLVKEFQFPSFRRAIDFVNQVAALAEEIDHHPIITVNWTRVRLSLISFDVGQLTSRDFRFARLLDERLRPGLRNKPGLR